MNIYAFVALVNAAAITLLGSFVYLKNKKNPVNQTYGLFSFFVALWSFAYYFWQISNNYSDAIFWSRLLISAAIFIPITYFHFLLKLLDEKRRIVLFTGYFLSFVLFILNFTPFMVKDVVPKLSFNYWPEPGAAFHVFILMFFFFIVYGLRLAIKGIAKSEGIKKMQLKYVFYGAVIGFLGGSTNYFLWYDIPIPPSGNFLISIYAGVVAYAVLRYRLMDIKLFFGHGVVYLFSFATTIGITFLLITLNDFYKILIFKTATPIILAVGILTFNFFFKLYEKLASRYFYYKFYNYQTVLTDLSGKLNEVLELEKLSSIITDTLANTMRLDKTGILIRDPKTKKYETEKIYGFNEENGISLVKDNFLTEWLLKNKKPLVREELNFLIRDANNKKEIENLEELKKNMEKIEANICMPMFRKNQIIGIIVLGKKLSEEPYSKQDVDLLTHLANQASIALENARLYKELEELSKNLENKVNDQVANIKKLLKMKTEFLTVVNHQLRTPVSIIKGMSSMLVEESMPQKNKEEFIKKIYYSSERLASILDDILIAEDLIGKTENINFEPIQIEEIIKKTIKHFEFQAAAENIKIIFKKTGTPGSLFLSDSIMLEKIIERLLDNAILYTSLQGNKTKKKKILISLEFQKNKEKDFVQIEIKDDGIGLNEKDKKNLFKLFMRGERSVSLHPNGSGLGLFIVKNLVDNLQGKIEATSNGENKGAKFTIILPQINKI